MNDDLADRHRLLQATGPIFHRVTGCIPHRVAAPILGHYPWSIEYSTRDIQAVGDFPKDRELPIDPRGLVQGDVKLAGGRLGVLPMRGADTAGFMADLI